MRQVARQQCLPLPVLQHVHPWDIDKTMLCQTCLLVQAFQLLAGQGALLEELQARHHNLQRGRQPGAERGHSEQHVSNACVFSASIGS